MSSQINEMGLKEFQQAHKEWIESNFPGSTMQDALMGLAEEYGELNHHLLKQKQGIRGDEDFHENCAKDAAGDMLIFLMHLCTLRGWDIYEILIQTWDHVSKRDWNQNPENGQVE